MKKTLRQIVNETLDPATAQKMAPIVKKYADRATQDKSPDAQILNQLVAELVNSSKAQSAPQQPAAQQPAGATAQAQQ